MKQIIFAAMFAAIAFTATAQNGVASDSTWIETTGAMVYRVDYVLFESGAISTMKTPIGDTTSVEAGYANEMLQQVTTMANDLLITSRYLARIRGLIANANAIKTATGKDPLRTLKEDGKAYFLDPDHTWTLKSATTETIVFTETGAGVMRYKIGTAAAKSMTLLGPVVLLNNYAGTSDLMLVKQNNNIWVSADRLIVLRRSTR